MDFKVDYRLIAALIVAIIALSVIAVGTYNGEYDGIGDDINANETTHTPETVPEKITKSESMKSSESVALSFSQSLENEGYGDSSKVYIDRSGTILVRYSSSEGMTGNALKEDMMNIAVLYANLTDENYDGGALIIESSGIEATVYRNSAVAYATGNINEDAFKKTVEFR